VFIVGMVSDAQVDLIGVSMDVRTGRIDDRARAPVGVDLEDPSLFLIDPYDCVLHGELSSNEVWASADSFSPAVRPMRPISAIRRPG
jgi:hypothetical protein